MTALTFSGQDNLSLFWVLYYHEECFQEEKELETEYSYFLCLILSAISIIMCKSGLHFVYR